MANLKEIRNRITSVQSTRQITSAMKMVSAAKLKKAQDAIIRMRPYASKLKEILENLSASLESNEGIYSQQREIKSVLIVAITSNRGLCGGFNANVLKQVNKLIREEYKGKTITILSVGKKAEDFYRKTDYHIKGTTLPEQLGKLYDNLTFQEVAPVAQAIMEAFVNKQFDKVVLVYNQFKNAATQVLTTEQFLPVLPPNTKSKSNNDYIFEPDKKEIVQDLIPKSLKTQFYKAILDSNAAEHGARMTAMHKATDNASDLINELKLHYNKARQAAITGEILEIVAGAEALN